MRPCAKCGTERTPSGYCGAQGQHAVCALRAQLRDLRAERDALRIRILELDDSNAMACECPTANCDCAGCSYAREKGGAR